MAIMLLIYAIKLSVELLKFYTNSKKMKRTERLIVINIHEEAENCKIRNAENLNINILLQREEYGKNCMCT
jgi:hypothetical protein